MFFKLLAGMCAEGLLRNDWTGSHVSAVAPQWPINSDNSGIKKEDKIKARPRSFVNADVCKCFYYLTAQVVLTLFHSFV